MVEFFDNFPSHLDGIFAPKSMRRVKTIDAGESYTKPLSSVIRRI